VATSSTESNEAGVQSSTEVFWCSLYDAVEKRKKRVSAKRVGKNRAASIQLKKPHEV